MIWANEEIGTVRTRTSTIRWLSGLVVVSIRWMVSEYHLMTKGGKEKMCSYIVSTLNLS